MVTGSVRRVARIWFVVLIGVLPPGCDMPDARIRPAVYEMFLRQPGSTDALTVTVDLAEAPPSMEPLDVLFLFDATSSMSNVIDAVRERSLEIMESIQGLSRNTAVGVASLADYRSPGGPWVLHQQLTKNLSRARADLQGVTLRPSGNNDVPEAYSRALDETRFLSWRPDAQRYVILFGDAPAHDPTFYGRDLGIDPGRDGIPGTPDDLSLTGVVEDLRRANIRVLAIFDEEKRGGIWSDRSPLVDEAVLGFEYMARETGGLVKSVETAREIPSAIEGALRDTFRLRPALRAPTDWIEWVRVSEARPGGTDTRFEFDVVLQPPHTAVNGVHRFPLIATHAGDVGGAEIGYTGITVRLGWWHYRWRPVLVVLYLLGLLLTCLAWSFRNRNQGRRLPYRRHWSLLRLALRLSVVLMVAMGLYAVWVAAPGTLPPFSR